MKARPFFCLGIVTLVTQLSIVSLPSAVCFLLTAFCIIFSLGLFASKKYFISIQLIVIGIIALLQGCCKFYILEPLELLPQTFYDTTVQVYEISPSYNPEIQTAKCKIINSRYQPIEGYWAEILFPSGIVPGELLQGEMQFSLQEQTSIFNPQKADKIFLVGEVKDFQVSTVGFKNSFYTFRKNLKKNLIKPIQHYLSPDLSAIISAISFGEKESLSAEMRDIFKRAGLSHILVVSGLHLSIWAAFWIALFQQIRLKKLGILLAVAFSILFAIFIGISPSLFRAVIVVIIYCFCSLLFAKPDGLNTLGLAIFLLCIFNPFIVLDPSFWLSILATAGVLFGQIALSDTKIARKKQWGIAICKKEKYIWNFLQLATPCFFASIFTIPILILLEQEIAIFSILSNILVSYLILPLLLFSWITIVVGNLFFNTILHKILIFIVGLFTKILLSIAEFVANLPFATIVLEGIYPLLILGVFLVLWLVLWKLKKSRYLFVASPIMLFIIFLFNNILLKDTIAVVMVGNSTNPSIIMYDNQQAVVFFRGNISNQKHIQEFLEQKNLHLEFLLDLRMESETIPSLQADRILSAKEDIPLEGKQITALAQTIEIAIFPQKGASISFVDIYGITFAIPSGKGYWEEFPQVTFLIASKSDNSSLQADYTLTTSDWNWLDTNTIIGKQPGVRIWPSRAIRVEENLK